MGDEEGGQPSPPPAGKGPKGGMDDPSPPAPPSARQSPHILSSDKPRSSSVPHAEGEGEGLSSYCVMGMTNYAAGKKGTYIGYFLLVTGIMISIIAQASLFDNDQIDPDSSFIENCPSGFEKSCRGNQAVLRVSFSLVLVFSFTLFLTLLNPMYFDDWWILKFLIFGGLLALFLSQTVSGQVFDAHGYAWFARIGGFLFIMLQQVILLDFALTWSEKWLEYSEQESGLSQGLDRWKIGILVVGISFLVLSVVSNGLMFHYFKGCVSNDVINSLCLTSIVVGTVFQLFVRSTGSLLTSGVMALYYVYVTFSAITLGADAACNPTISGKPQLATTIIGMIIVVLSLSYTVFNTLRVLPDSMAGATSDSGASRESQVYAAPGLRMLLANVLIIFILASCYYAMVLTNWGTVQANFQLGNARQGSEAMWLQASAQWVCFFMYIWAQVAPLLFPDRFDLA